MPKLTFWGATEGVTGFAYLIKTERATVLLEYGLIQGRREEESVNRARFPFDIGALDAGVVSHAHLDHAGRLPKLVAEGCGGAIHMTSPTFELLEIMLKDPAYLEQRDAEWENKRRRREGKPQVEPLYTMEGVETALALCVGVPYGRRQRIAEGIEVCYRDAGQILGSAIIELFITEAGGGKAGFSGDLGGRSRLRYFRDQTLAVPSRIKRRRWRGIGVFFQDAGRAALYSPRLSRRRRRE